ncbi:LysR family transcriptional regulator [Bacterioplanes sanyensis]|uniref:LysR family transcriptional regulator n=1 Tax=Bacterioplanes sanyensis TaxID=1249553 RepID=UPI0016781145|nr:LysR family transcriptional regulator [Bacterioplanes sanyensis]GGY33961.1 LysR family transcriptional regulator [Bacterioplanes sanyensis]
MELKHIKAFVSVMDCGSLSAAARQLGKGQSLLSQWISELEADTGLALFERSGNRAVPTSQAWQWLPWAQQALSELEALERRTQALAGDELWQLQLAIEHSLTADWLAPALRDWHKQWPGRCIQLSGCSRDELIDGLQQQHWHLGVGYEHEDHMAEVSYQRLGELTEVYVASPDWLASVHSKLDAAALRQATELVWAQASDGCESALNLNAWLIAELTLLKQLACQGVGYALLPQWAVAEELTVGSLQVFQPTFETPTLVRRIEMLWPAGLELQAPVASLQQLLVQHGVKKPRR